MSKVTMVGSFQVADGKGDEAEEVLTEMVAAATDEPGVEVYSYHREGDTTFWFFAVMSDADTMQGHGQTPKMQAAMQRFMPLVAAPPDMHTAAPIAGLGIEL